MCEVGGMCVRWEGVRGVCEGGCVGWIRSV